MVKFGTGGWRAIIGEEFTKENIQKLALAICLKMKAEGVVITEIQDSDKWKEACAPMLEEYRAKGDNWSSFIDRSLEAQK